MKQRQTLKKSFVYARTNFSYEFFYKFFRHVLMRVYPTLIDGEIKTGAFIEQKTWISGLLSLTDLTFVLNTK